MRENVLVHRDLETLPAPLAEACKAIRVAYAASSGTENKLLNGVQRFVRNPLILPCLVKDRSAIQHNQHLAHHRAICAEDPDTLTVFPIGDSEVLFKLLTVFAMVRFCLGRLVSNSTIACRPQSEASSLLNKTSQGAIQNHAQGLSINFQALDDEKGGN